MLRLNIVFKQTVCIRELIPHHLLPLPLRRFVSHAIIFFHLLKQPDRNLISILVPLNVYSIASRATLATFSRLCSKPYKRLYVSCNDMEYHGNSNFRIGIA